MKTVPLAVAARRLNVSEASIRRWCDSGKLAHWVTFGGHRRVSEESIEECRRLRGGANESGAESRHNTRLDAADRR